MNIHWKFWRRLGWSLVRIKGHAVNEWRGCIVAWTETRGRLEALAAVDGLFK